MEKRAILAALLMAGLLMVYQLLFVKPPDSRQPAPPQKVESPGPVSQAAPSQPIVAPGPPPAIVPKEASPVPERQAVVETPLYRAVIDSKGGRIAAWELNYRGQKPMVVSDGLDGSSLAVMRPGAEAQTISFALSAYSLKLDKDMPQGELKLVGEDGFGLRVTQTLRFRADTYAMDRDVQVENRHNVAQSAEILLGWAAPVAWPKDQAEKFQGQHPVRAVRMVAGAIRREELAKVTEFRGDGQWVGLESEWYLTALIPASAGFQLSEAKASETRRDGSKGSPVVEIGLRAALPGLQPGQSWQGRASAYLGPKEYTRLKALGVGLEKSIYFGGFPLPQAYGGLPMEWLAVPILWLMHLFYSWTGNYGVAIILLTVITKVLFFPLTIKSMTSMRAMQALQPQINALRAKYKSDPQRLQRETMELYRAHKVNPLGGCLPMVVQVPIFYALYVALSVSVEIQNAPFICFGRLFGVDLWICDLAAHDPTYVLPLLMGASMFIQQKMTPVMGDPRQAKMMLFMPIVFTFMFLNLPSGLVLYWTLSNVLQIAQQKYMERSAKLEKVPARAPRKA